MQSRILTWDLERLRGEKVSVISELRHTAREKQPVCQGKKKSTAYQYKAYYEVLNMPSLSGTKGTKCIWLPPQGRRLSYPINTKIVAVLLSQRSTISRSTEWRAIFQDRQGGGRRCDAGTGCGGCIEGWDFLNYYFCLLVRVPQWQWPPPSVE